MTIADDRYRGAPTGPPTGPPGSATAGPSALSDALPVEALPLDALCTSALASYRDELAAQDADHPWLALPQEDLLVRLNAACRSPKTGRLHPTRAGLLMFGYEHEIATVFPRYMLDYCKESDAGETVMRIISNDGRWSGCVFDFWLRVSDLLVADAGGIGPPGRTRPGEGGDMHAAIREGLANALVHADYGGRRHVVITQRPDSIEYANPGRLRVRSGIAFEGGISDVRNPTLMKMFMLVGACVAGGTGLPLIRRALARASLPDPIISQQTDPDRTVLTMPSCGALMLSSRPRAHPIGAESSPATQCEPKDIPPPGAGPPAAEVAEMPLRERGPDLFDRVESAATPQSARLFSTPLEEKDANTSISAQSTHHAAAPRGQLGEDDAAVDAAIARAADEDLRSVLELFRSQRRIRRADVESILGIGSTKAKSIVAALVSDGLITTEGGGRSTYYKLARR